jgi:pimeloyl-ACP methyl ester carboxylesterase
MRRLEANGTTIAYARTGAGPPIELMHGAEADHSMFAPLAAQLKKQLTVIAYDQRDSGDTRNPRQPCTLKDMGDDAAALIKGLAIEKAHVYGTSFGSLIAQSLAIRHPECVDRLVLSAAIRIGKTLRDIAPETARRLQELRADRVKNAERIARIFYPEPHPAGRPPRSDRAVQDPAPYPGQQQWLRPCSGRSHYKICPGSRRRRWCSLAARIAWFHALIRLSIAEEIPGAQTSILEGVGHVNAIKPLQRQPR